MNFSVNISATKKVSQKRMFIENCFVLSTILVFSTVPETNVYFALILRLLMRMTRFFKYPFLMQALSVYYCRKLCVYNLTVYESASPNNAYCFCWSENDGKRGSCEIGSCLLQWFKALPTHVKEVSLFSDT